MRPEVEGSYILSPLSLKENIQLLSEYVPICRLFFERVQILEVRTSLTPLPVFCQRKEWFCSAKAHSDRVVRNKLLMYPKVLDCGSLSGMTAPANTGCKYCLYVASISVCDELGKTNHLGNSCTCNQTRVPVTLLHLSPFYQVTIEQRHVVEGCIAYGKGDVS